MSPRRTLISIGVAALAMPSVARAQTSSRRYRLDRTGSDSGTHDISIGRSGNMVTVATTAYALGAELPATVHYTASGE